MDRQSSQELKPTVDPYVFMEEVRDGYTRYVQFDSSKAIRRWEVHGKCIRLGNCLIGSVIDGEVVRDHQHLKEIAERKPGRMDSELDVPVTPEFYGCCPFTYRELEV